ncbi:hypothetical protein GCM10009795_096750 [Nocardioides hankookensis]|uniref:Uncharacterized protein n=1 Tax=Nocardioides hankookensis TaxID=443157 RepID=A0ABW1LNK3_9ACTN
MTTVEAIDRVEDPEELIAAIAAALTGPELAYREVVPATDPDVEGRIALVRSCGRKAGRRLGVSVQTVATGADGVIRFGGMAIAIGREDGGREVQVINATR